MRRRPAGARVIELARDIFTEGAPMPWNPWIQIEPDDTTNEAAKQLFKKTRNAMTGDISDLTRLTSLTPRVAERIDDLCTAVYRDAGFTPREKEILALVTSSLIGCVH
ncbi:MAG: carboxymuconolactone decarboxylase family protein [bacterium]|nr:carboxymuconolactone decarboxylase family protein [bacterium]